MLSPALLLILVCSTVVAGEAVWAERSGSDGAGAWAEISVGGTVQRLRWRTFSDGAQAWLGEAPLPPAAVRAIIPDIPDPRSLRWRGEQDIADVHAICDAVERAHPRLRCLLPRLAWLQQAFPQPRADWPRLWTGDLVQGWVAYQPIGGTRFDDVMASRLWGPPWSDAEVAEPPFPKRDPDSEEFSEEDRYGFTSDGNEPVPWVRPIDRIGRANDGQVPLAALRYAPPVETAEDRSGSGLLGYIFPARPDGGARQKVDGSSLWVLRDGKPERVAITPGSSDGRVMAVTSDALKEGDLVITDQREAG
ncbi:MAG: hypothetical protein J0M02_17630 [Planctomycetes bacterium]|nr:hypothetical protein [Planctomycetota bacterium]